jgi:hypothetical protein
MKKHVLRVSATELGFASIDAQSRDIDWREASGESCDGWEVQMPRPTYGAISENALDLLTAAQKRIADRDQDRPAPRALAEQFEESDRYWEWRDGFEPMMNYVWPAFLPYGMDSADLADRLNVFAPNMTLVYFGEHSPHCPEPYGFALNGGGMNLSDHIAAAYLCAHQVPPVSILQGLAGVISPYMLARIGGPLRAAYRQAARNLRQRASRLAEESGRVFAPKG